MYFSIADIYICYSEIGIVRVFNCGMFGDHEAKQAIDTAIASHTLRQTAHCTVRENTGTHKFGCTARKWYQLTDAIVAHALLGNLICPPIEDLFILDEVCDWVCLFSVVCGANLYSYSSVARGVNRPSDTNSTDLCPDDRALWHWQDLNHYAANAAH
jgi:hypothetical protein